MGKFGGGGGVVWGEREREIAKEQFGMLVLIK